MAGQDYVASMLESIKMLASQEILMRLLASLVILIISITILLIIKNILFRIAEARGRDRRAIENTYRMIKASLGTVTLFLIIFILTQEAIIAIFLLGVILVVLAASWEIIANIVSYYSILLYQVLERGEYVRVGSFEGVVRDITPLFTLIEDEYGVVAVPNRLVVTKGRVLIREPVKVVFSLKVWGLDDPKSLDSLLSSIRERLEPSLRAISAIPGEVSMYIDEISGDSVSIKLEVLLPGPKVGRARVEAVLREVASFMWGTGYSFSVAIEKPEWQGRVI